MKVIVIATGTDIAGGGEREIEPAELRWTIDRPFVQHVVEKLVDGGAQEIHFVLARRPEHFEQLLGDGSRWGARFSYHLAMEAGRPYDVLGTVPVAPGEEILLVHADQLVSSPYWIEASRSPCAFVWNAGWTGWARVRMDWLVRTGPGLDRAGLWMELGRECAATEGLICVPEPLQTRDCGDFHRSVGRVLRGEHEGLLLFGYPASPGVWLERNVSLDATARLVPPVYLGENCHVGPGVTIGPGAAIGANSYVDQKATVVESVIQPGTYVGEGVEIERAIVDRESLVDLPAGAAVTVPDELLLGSLEGPALSPAISGFFFRLIALLLLVITTPVLAALRLGSRLGFGPTARTRAFLRLPAPLDRHGWVTSWTTTFAPPGGEHNSVAGMCHFLHHVVPGLPAVVLGRLDLVGLPLRTRDEVERLDREWRMMYLGGRSGLISERLIEFGDGATPGESFAAEALHVSRRGFIHDLRLFVRYIAIVMGLATPSPIPEPSGRWSNELVRTVGHAPSGRME